MPAKVKTLAVLVLYRRLLADSVTWKALVAQVDGRLQEVADFRLLVCDNGPLSELPPLPDWVDYLGVQENRGLAWAYNYSLSQATANGADWLLTLDQDTALPADYLMRMVAKVQQLDAAGREDSEDAKVCAPVGAIVPQLVSEGGSVHSPVLAGKFGEQKIDRGFAGLAKGDVRPFNSGAMMRITALQAAGGYDRRFWLNYLDHAIFHAIQQAGFVIWIAGDLQVQHHLSLDEGRDGMGEQHFRHFSAAEAAFRDLHAPSLEGLLFTARLFLRLFNQKRRRDPAHFADATAKILKQRLTLSKSERMRRWEMDVAAMATEPQIAIRQSGSSAATTLGKPSGQR